MAPRMHWLAVATIGSRDFCTIHPSKVYVADCGAITGAIECWRMCSVSRINS